MNLSDEAMAERLAALVHTMSTTGWEEARAIMEIESDQSIAGVTGLLDGQALESTFWRRSSDDDEANLAILEGLVRRATHRAAVQRARTMS